MKNKSTFGICVEWANTAIGWIKKGVRRNEVKNIESAANSGNAKYFNNIMQRVEKARKQRADGA